MTTEQPEDADSASQHARWDTPLTRLLQIRRPILLAPMGAVAGGRLAAAVTRAGGLGLVGVGYAGSDFVERELDAAQGLPVGVGFITWDLARDPRRLEVALERRPALVQLSFGDAAPFVAPIQRAGVKLALQVQTLADARRAADLGADLIVAQGTEAGGHGGSRALFPLLPAVVDAVAPLPVVAAGGIADGRGLAAALTLGASGALVGTRFMAAEESLAPVATKAKLIESSGDATVRTRVFDIVRGLAWPEPYTGRALINQFTRAWHGREGELFQALASEGPRYAAAASAGELQTALVWAGEGVDLVRRFEDAASIVDGIALEAEAALARARMALPAS